MLEHEPAAICSDYMLLLGCSVQLDLLVRAAVYHPAA